MKRIIPGFLACFLAMPAVATNVVSGAPVTITARVTVDCTGATLVRIRNEWSTTGDAVTELSTGTGVTTSGGRGSTDSGTSIALEPGVPHEIKLRAESQKGKEGTLTTVTTFWYSDGADCTGERTTASFIEFKAE